ncbi:MAG TPA: [protein-PII] uridylyltransferase, partial [Mycobacteriales bacterium]|nr:[protein-PII] uridylyltransferase [Mycobacteriales bacterium]
RGVPTRSDRAALLARRDGEGRALSGRALCEALSDHADGWLAELLGPESDVALVAVGGYGRRELSPASDLDLMLLHTGRRDIGEVADRIWYPVWDTGVALDHSVRTTKEALAVADADLKAVLGLLDARHVAGDPVLTSGLLRALREQWRRRAPRALVELCDGVRARHDRAGEVAFLLEPDLKECRGGLRDVAAVHAAAAAWVVDPPGPRVRSAYDVLLTVRAELHRRTGRPGDQLTLQEQDAVAAATGHPDAAALMSAVADAGRTVAYATDETMRRIDGWLSGRERRRTRPVRSVPVAPGLARHGDEIVLAVGSNAVADPTLPLRAAAAAAGAGLRISTATLERLAADAPEPPHPWPTLLRDALIEVLGAGRAGLEVLEALDQHGLLVRLLPEWAAVRSRSQRNPYHRFTVDRHLCEAAAFAGELTRSVARPDLLLAGTWLHDIGKGYPGDHTEAGVVVVADVATRMGFARADVEVLVAMVRHHLLLPDVATRRDLDDPATVEAVAKAVGDRDLLDLLAALTVADSRATGPAAWSEWKAELVTDLVRRTAALLADERPDPAPGLLDRYAELVTAGGVQVLVSADSHRVVVIAPDRPGLLWRVAGALALHRLDVRSAVIAALDGTAVQEIDVTPAFRSEPDRLRVAEDVRRSIAGRLAVDSRLADRARAFAGRARGVAPAPPRVLVDQDASRSATLIEVRAADDVGVLYRIARALADCELDVRSAKVATIGLEVVDTFYVLDSSGAKVTDVEHLKEAERAVVGELSRS